MLGAFHKPGAIPLRPLTLGDIYDAAFKIIRFNPRATVGSAVLVAAVAMALPVLVTAVLSLVVDLSLAGTDDPAGADLVGFFGAFGALGVGSVLQSIGLVLVTGMIAHVTMAAAVGRRLSLAEAWAATRGRRWRLIGMTLLLGLMLVAILGGYALSWIPVVALGETWMVVVWGLVTVPLLIAFLCWFWVRVYYLPAPALMLEDVTVPGALGRGFALTRGAFWRTFGIALLTMVIAQVAGSMLSFPISVVSQVVLLGGVTGEAGFFLLIVGQALSTVVASAFVTPFTATVASLQYVDLRMRQEAFDVELMHRAGITRS
jgi:hypothetical protein